MPACSDVQLYPRTSVSQGRCEIHQNSRPASPSGSKIHATSAPTALRKEGENVIADAKWNYGRACVSRMFLAGCFFPKVPELQRLSTPRTEDRVLVIGTPRNPSSRLSLGKIALSKPIQTISFLPTHLAFSFPLLVLCNLPNSAWFGSGQTCLNQWH